MKDPKTPEDKTFEIYNQFHYYCRPDRFRKLFARLELYKLTRGLPGDIFDAGVYKGISSIQFAHMVSTFEPHSSKRVFGFDTFDSVFPRRREDEKFMTDRHMTSYSPDALQSFTEALERLDMGDQVEIVKGDVVQTIPELLETRPGLRISLLHCDLDVYEPTLEILNSTWARLVSGAVVIFDEYGVDHWGESDAVDEFFAAKGIRSKLLTTGLNSTPTAYCIKE
jgi:hypothetical protein